MSTANGPQNHSDAIEEPIAPECPAQLRLRQLALHLPEGGTVNLDRTALERLAGPLGDDPDSRVVEAYLTVAKAAKALSLSRNRVRGLISEGKLSAFRIGGVGGWRITAEALRRFREAGTPPATSHAEGPVERVDLGR
jgi:excisionase family DNA binding protein